MLPHQGAGASQAVEDAFILSRLLAHPRCTLQTLPSVLKTYDMTRRPRATRVLETSAEAGMLYEYRDPYGAGDDIEKISKRLHGRMEWIWDIDLEVELKRAFDHLGWS